MAFRNAAQAEATRQKLAQAIQGTKDSPAYHKWFLTFTNPRGAETSGSRHRLLGADGNEGRSDSEANGNAPSLHSSARAHAESNDDGYVSSRNASTLTAWSLSRLSKLCVPGGPVRYRRPAGNRLEIHATDLVAHVAKLANESKD